MATEKYFCFDEQGELKRIKGRLVRFLDNEAPTGSDKSAIRTSLEVSPDAEGLVQADVGTAPNEIPVNGMLGDMAYQSSDSVSIATLEVTDHIESFTVKSDGTSDTPAEITLQAEDGSINTNDRIGTLSIAGMDNSATPLTGAKIEAKADSTWSASTAPTRLEFSTTPTGSTTPSVRAVIDNQGRVGVNNTSPGSYGAAANNLVVGSGSGAEGITIATGTASQGSIYFADATGTGIGNRMGQIYYDHNTNELVFGVNGNARWKLDSTGNLVALSTVGIDFGSTTTGVNSPTVESGLLDDYEEGRLVVTATPATSGTITLDTGNDNLSYTKVGRKVSITGVIVLSSVSSPVGNYISVSLPFEVANLNNGGGNVSGSCFTYNAAGNSGDYSILALEGQTYFRIYKNTASSSVATAADFSGDEIIYIGLTYFAA